MSFAYDLKVLRTSSPGSGSLRSLKGRKRRKTNSSSLFFFPSKRNVQDGAFFGWQGLQFCPENQQLGTVDWLFFLTVGLGA